MTSTTGSSAGPAGASSTPQRAGKGMIGALFGTALEVFDWSIYNTFAPFFAAAFFVASSENSTSAFLNTLLVFAVGFVARPIGSLVFGHISDRYGRKASLFGTSATAMVGTLMIALAPTHEVIGVGAALILFTARVTQGLAHGGEQPAASAYVSELAPKEHRGRWSSLIYVFTTLGGTLGSLLGALLTTVFTPEQMTSWVWRVPFVVGAIGSAITLYIISRIPESTVFTDDVQAGPEPQAGPDGRTGGAVAATAARPNVFADMWASRTTILKIIGMTLGLTIAFQTWAAIGGYHIAVLGSDASAVLWTMVVTSLLFMLWMPLWGALSDRIGRRPVMIIGFGGVALVSYPALTFLDGSWQHLFVAVVASQFFLAAPCAIQPALMAEIVPTRMRTIGVGFGYALGTAIFGGTAPYLQTWVSTNWGLASYAWYVVVAVAISIAVVVSLPETRGINLRDGHREAHLTRNSAGGTTTGSTTQGARA